jgi:hypothetical protein
MAFTRERDGTATPVRDRDDRAPAAQPRAEEAFRKESRPDVWEVRAGCIGRGHAGKTALFRAMSEGPVGDFFPSGLHIDVGDPREVARMIRESEETQRILQASGLPPTLEASQIRYYLYDGDRQCVVYKMREVIGQVLTHTLPDSAPEQQARYDDYLKGLLSTHVLWAVVPCPPPNPSPRDHRRYSNDLRITSAYLREALRLRTLDAPAAVALVLSKIDTLFADADEARGALPDDVLRNALGPLVHLVGKSSHVADAVILPVTAFGFGNAVLRSQGGGPGEAPVDAAGDPFAAEPTWLLKEGAVPRPYNLDTLVVWTLLFGLLNQNADNGPEGKSEVGELCRLLRDDLLGEERWFLPLKGRLAEG